MDPQHLAQKVIQTSLRIGPDDQVLIYTWQHTIPIPPEKRLPNLTVRSVASLLGEVIKRAHEGRSVGEMFNE